MSFKKTPMDTSWHSDIFLFWILDYCKIYGSEPPTEKNLFEIPEKFNPNKFTNELEILWEEEIQKKTPSFFNCIFTLKKRDYIQGVVLNSISHLLSLGTVVSLYFIYMYLYDDGSALEGVLIASAAAFCLIFSVIFKKVGFFKINILRYQLMYAIITIIQKKIFRLKLSEAKNQDSISKIINSVSSDLEILNVMNSTVDLFAPLLRLIACIGILIWLLGPAGLIGVGISILHIPIVVICALFMFSNMEKSGDYTISRVGIMKNFIESIQTLKVFAWEKDFINRVNKERISEISYMQRFHLIRGFLKVINIGGTFLSIFAAVIVYIYADNRLNLGESLLVINCLCTLQLLLPYVLMMSLSTIFMMLQTFKKAQEILLFPENNSQVVENEKSGIIVTEKNIQKQESDETISEENQESEYKLLLEGKSNDSKEYELSKFNFTIEPGELVMIVGKVGSGKSRLLQMLLGEDDSLNLNVTITPNSAYYSEEPWIMNASIKDNIIMGRTFNPELYSEVLKLVCLEDDISHMPNGDETIISERGNTISGGQKARLALARVLYTEADLYLLDDPFSSLDSRILKKVFKKSVLGMLSNKTRVLIMRNNDYLKYADKIILIENCQMKFFGTFNEFKELFVEIDFSGSTKSKKYAKGTHNLKILTHNLNYDIEINEIYQKPLKFSTPFKYFGIGCNYNIILIITVITSICYLIIMLYFYYIMSDYADSDPSLDSTMLILYIIITYYIVLIFTVMPMSYNINNSNLNLHNKASKNLSKCPSDHFDKNTCGTILNYFTTDTSTIDRILAFVIQEFSLAAVSVIGTLVIMMILIPYSIIYTSWFFIQFYYLSKYVLSIYNKIKRLDIISRGSINASTHSTLLGVTTIRNLKIQEYIFKIMEKYSLTFYRICITGDYFVSMYIDSFEQVIAVITMINIILIIATDGYFNEDLSLIGLNMLIVLSNAISGLFIMIANIDNGMISVQNLFDMAELPTEKNLAGDIKKNIILSHGKIEFRSLSVNYGNKTALSNISCIIQPKSKVAILGRTGAGKSTIFKTILRLINPSSGTILFDDQDYLNFTYKSIRRSVAASPQAGIIFYGSIRQNLDPYKYHSDEELDKMLSKLHLESILQKKLDDETFGIESQLSIGEKQLFCLARILLKKSKIVLIDEATSSIDYHTDSITQEIIHAELADCTILTISHRLTTFQNYNYALIVDHGILAEYGLITDLESDPDSNFNRFKDDKYRESIN